MKKPTSSTPVDPELQRQLGRMTRRGLAIGGASIIAGAAGLKWTISRSTDGNAVWPLRRVLELNEKVGRASFSPSRLAPEFALAKARMPKVNGKIGLELADPDLAKFRLKVEGPGGARLLSMAEIRVLPRVEMTTELKCVEGWATVVRWAGVRLSDLAALAGLATRSGRPPDPIHAAGDLLDYVSMVTPDAKYFVGLEALAAFHPQSLICYEMDGLPLSRLHGAPLRLATPVKYGYKSIKNIGLIRFTDQRPADYWAGRGYDWYAGH